MDLYNPDGSVDVGKLLRGKWPGISPFMVKLAKKILREDFMNAYFVQGYEGVDFCTHSFDYLNVKIEAVGLDKIPKDGRYTFASNHPLGGIDGVGICGVIGEYFDGNIRFLVNDFLMAIKGLAPLEVPVNKVGAQSRTLSQDMDNLFNSDHQVVIFPSGKCSRKIDGKIQDPEWKKAFITRSVQSKRDIVPVHFYGRNSWRFYMMDSIGKLIGVDSLAMAFLPDELYRGQGKSFKVVFGDPIPYTTFDNSKKPIEWAKWVREKAYSL